jgi:hypothetical protein
VAYAAFSSDRIGSYLLSRNSVQPLSGDPSDYVVFESGDKTLRYGFTPTCAANVLGLVPDGDSSRANEAFPGPWDQVVDLKALSEEILRASSSKLAQTVEQLLLEYKLDRNWTTLVGGGGGASAIVPHLAKTLGMKFEIAKDNDVISAIGVALGLVREVVERSVVNPTHEDIYRIRGEAREKVIEQGADPAQIEVFIEVDTKKNVVRAEAQGTIEFKNNLKSGESTQGSSLDPADMSDDALSGLAKVALGLTVNPHVIKRARASRLSVATFSSTQKSFFGLRQSEHSYATVMDSRGVVRLRLSEPDIVESTAGTLVQTLKDNLDHQVTYDDGGTLYPQIFALLGDRIIDLSKLQTPDHFSTVLGMEAGEAPANEPAVLIFSKRNLEEEK